MTVQEVAFFAQFAPLVRAGPRTAGPRACTACTGAPRAGRGEGAAKKVSFFPGPSQKCPPFFGSGWSRYWDSLGFCGGGEGANGHKQTSRPRLIAASDHIAGTATAAAFVAVAPA